MEMTDELKVLVTAEVDKAVKNLGELDKKTNETENSFRKLGEVLASAALTKAVVSFGQESVQAAEDASRSMRLLASTVEATGANAWTSADALHKMAVEFRDLTGIDNGKIESMQTVLLGFKNITGATFKKATGAILDMATVMNMDLSSAAQAVGKALDDPINGLDSLRRQGFAFTEAQKEVIKALIESGETAEAQEIILKELEGTYGGAAKAANNAFSQLQNAFGELKETVGNHIQPLVSDVAEGILDLIERFDGLDAGTQRMILAAGGLVAVMPGVILAIKGLSAAMATLAANPVILGISSVAAAIGLIAGYAYNAAHAEEDLRKELIETKNSADALLDSFGGLDGEKKLDAKSTADLIALYPELATEIKAYATSVDEAREAVRKLTAQEMENSLQSQINKLIKWQGQVDRLNELLEDQKKNFVDDLNGKNKGEYSDDPDWQQGVNAPNTEMLAKGIQDTSNDISELESKITTSVQNINDQLKTVGKTLDTSSWKIVDLIAEPQKVEEEIEKAVEPVEKAVVKTKKTWAEWFTDITGTKVDLTMTGGKAGQAYLDGFTSAFDTKRDLFEKLGESFDERDELKAKAEKIKSDLINLLSIDPNDIAGNEAFTLDEKKNPSIKKMIDEYNSVMKQLKPTWQEFLADTLDVDPAEFGEDGKKAVQLYIEGIGKELADANELSEILGEKFDLLPYLEKQRDEVRDKIEELLGEENLDQAFTSESEAVQELAEYYRVLSKEIDEFSESEVQIISWEDALTDSLERGLEKLGFFSAEARQIIAELGTSLASVSFDSVLSGLSTFGEAIGNGKDATDSMREAMASMAQQILDSLPTMFLQAGLQLIAQGQWALGLGFVAAGGASSFISGFVSGRTSGNTEANALGGVYGDEFYAAFAKGGTFTNGIVTSPTYFKFARGGGFGTGLMGEAGPEAIMPLTRGADGSLGVTASGLGMSLQVVINNYGSEEVRAEETTGENGQRQLEITIGTLINRHISGGMADKAMSSRFGIKAKGV